MSASRSAHAAVLSVVALTLIAAPVLVAGPAAAATVSTTIDGVTYTADDTAVASGATVTAYSPGPANVVIPGHVTIGPTSYPVTAIGGSVFANSGITSVTIPDTVLTIGAQAFRSADSLVTVDLGDGVTTIGEFAFTNDGHVTDIEIPDSVTSIGQWAFDSMDLRTLTIGAGLTAIGVQVFSNNNRLESVVIPPGVTSIAFAAFAADDLRDLVVGSGVTSIGDFGFAYNNRLASVRFPPSVTSLGASVFQNNSSGMSFLATFEGPAPTTFGAAVFAVSDPSIRYAWRYGVPQSAGGFTSPTWNGYPARALATLSFDTGGLTANPPDLEVLVGDLAIAPPAPTAAGLVFQGWTDGPGGTPFAFSSPVSGDVDLNASWASAPALAATGSDLGPTSGIAAALLAAGGAVTAIALRRRLGSATPVPGSRLLAG